MKILVIEDNEQILNAFRIVLEAEDHFVDTALNPLVGISKAMRSAYDLLLIDYMLPEITGDEIVRRLRAEHIKTPIIVLTNLGSGFDEQQMLELGAQEVVLKSTIGPDELRKLASKYARK